MKSASPSFSVNVDPTNPGQFFACCGMLELADRLWPGAEGWFGDSRFMVAGRCELRDVLAAAKEISFGVAAEAEPDEVDDAQDEDDSVFEPLLILSPIQMRLDWWQNKSIKTWAGSMKVGAIARAMSYAIDVENTDPFNQGQVVFDPPPIVTDRTPSGKRPKQKKREPFCFDSRRGTSSRSVDTGFSTNDLKLTTTAFPVVELFCLLGLQRCRPLPAEQPRRFTYSTWTWPCTPELLPAAVAGLINDRSRMTYSFENAFRSGQKKHKAFRSSVPLSNLGDSK